jgi:hypothetical protein
MEKGSTGVPPALARILPATTAEQSMNEAYLPALAALVGSAIGGLTSLATTWLTQRGQTKMQQITQDRVQRETLFAQFIDEASALYGDAFEHEGTELSKLSKLFALVSRMRLLAPQEIVQRAEQVAHAVIDTYLAPNKTFREIGDLRSSGAMDPLKNFAEACREELRKYGG